MNIKLLGPHKHDCTQYPAGAEVDLADWEANWLIGLGKAERSPEASDVVAGEDNPPMPPPAPVLSRKERRRINTENAG